MNTYFKPRRELIFLIIGILLIVGGVVGGILLFRSGNQDQSMVDYFLTATYSPVKISTTETIQPETAKVTGTAGPAKANANIGAFLDFEAYSAHADPAIGLENPKIPDRIVIPAIGLDAPVVTAGFNRTDIQGETFGQWKAPNQYAAGWHPDSALLGKPGNTVIDGHHNEFGEVFGKLVDIQIGDEIDVYSKGEKFSFVVANYMILPELFQTVETRLNNARWLAHTDDTRLTLVTCWPKLTNTHRLIVVASPLEK